MKRLIASAILAVAPVVGVAATTLPAHAASTNGVTSSFGYCMADVVLPQYKSGNAPGQQLPNWGPSLIISAGVVDKGIFPSPWDYGFNCPR